MQIQISLALENLYLAFLITKSCGNDKDNDKNNKNSENNNEI